MDNFAQTVAHDAGVGFASEHTRRLFWYVHNCAHQTCARDWECDRKSYGGHQIIFIVRGRGSVRYDGRDHEAGPGDAIVMDLRRPHRYACDPKDPLEIYWARFDGPGVAAVVQAMLDAAGSPILKFASRERMRADFHELFRLLKNREPGNDLWVWHRLTALVANVMERNQAEKSSADVAPALQLMRERYDRPLALEALAQASGLSMFHFTRRFKRSTGFTPMEYLEKLRIAHAQELLQSRPDLLLKAVAKQSGYDDPAYFSRVFHKRTGVSPTAYRKSLAG